MWYNQVHTGLIVSQEIKSFKSTGYGGVMVMNCVKTECEYNWSNKTKLKLSIFNKCNLLSLFLSKLKALQPGS